MEVGDREGGRLIDAFKNSLRGVKVAGRGGGWRIRATLWILLNTL
jgi:hypothetical protein